MSVSSAPVETLFKIDSAIPRAPVGPRSPIQNTEYASKETHPTMIETTVQESPASPVGRADKGVAITGSPAGEATLSPRSMLARARASPPRKSLIIEELLALPEEKPAASLAKAVAANDAVPVHVEEGPTGPQSAFNFLPKSQIGKSKVLPRSLTIRRPQPYNAWRRPSTILQNSLELIGCEDSLVDEFDDLAVFVDIRRRNVFEDAWINVIAAITIAGRTQDMDEESLGSPVGEDVMAMVGCGSMDDPVVEFVPRAGGGKEEV
ncbi:hypothetical protein FRC04_008978 [Tulasnella sp. 424]|nr:hypothetical protein FRC04_008978 [Tulasnella sp. 424]KAG8973635.1 hypothetical protein FRC05_008571 [Tulasnella sp. 425]